MDSIYKRFHNFRVVSYVAIKQLRRNVYFHDYYHPFFGVENGCADVAYNISEQLCNSFMYSNFWLHNQKQCLFYKNNNRHLIIGQFTHLDIYRPLEVVLDAPGANDEHPTPFVE